jgi:hypothetical protein
MSNLSSAGLQAEFAYQSMELTNRVLLWLLAVTHNNNIVKPAVSWVIDGRGAMQIQWILRINKTDETAISCRQTKLTWPAANWLRLIACWKLNKRSIYASCNDQWLFNWSHVDSVQKFWTVGGTTDLDEHDQGQLNSVLWIYSEAVLHWGFSFMYFSIRIQENAVRKG